LSEDGNIFIFYNFNFENVMKKIGVIETNVKTELKIEGEGKTTYTFSVSVNAFSVEFPLACYQQAGRVWYVSGALRRTYTLFYPAPLKYNKVSLFHCQIINQGTLTEREGSVPSTSSLG
jgi:hypothetical protein